MAHALARRRSAPIVLAELSEQAREYVAQAKSENTLRAYRSDWADFLTWCDEHQRQALPATPEAVALYLTARAETHRPATLQRRISAISQAHQAAGYDSPTSTLAVRAVWAGIRRVHGTAQQGKAPTMTDDIRAMVETLPKTLAGQRDRALLVVGFAGAFRRSELVSLLRSDVEISRDGLTITLRRSKTDQEGAGRKIGIPYGAYADTCPVRSLQDWLKSSGIKGGSPLFRKVDRHGNLGAIALSDKAVALVVKRSAEAAGLDPARYAGHSLRAGLATSAAAAGKSERAIMAQTGHKSVTMVRRYIRDGSLFRENASAGIGL